MRENRSDRIENLLLPYNLVKKGEINLRSYCSQYRPSCRDYLDGDLLTNPVVNDAITGGSAVITGQRTLEEAKDGVKTIMEDKKFGDAGTVWLSKNS